jgi:hypothetical protein
MLSLENPRCERVGLVYSLLDLFSKVPAVCNSLYSSPSSQLSYLLDVLESASLRPFHHAVGEPSSDWPVVSHLSSDLSLTNLGRDKAPTDARLYACG